MTSHLVPTLQRQKLSLLTSLLNFCTGFEDCSVLLFCIASHIVIDLTTTIAIEFIIALLRSKGDCNSKKQKKSLEKSRKEVKN